MSRTLLCALLLVLLPATLHAQEKKAAPGAGSDVKALSGISIVGNDDAPKSLYIVPWKGSELGDDSGLRPGLLDARAAPVDREVFMREVDYYGLRSPQ